MNHTAQIARHLREVHTGTNWTWSNLRDVLSGITWQQATTKLHDLNTIAVLTYHINYYLKAAISVLQGRPLQSKDEESFTHPPIQSQEDWDALTNTSFQDAETLANLIEQFPDERLGDTFVQDKYGSYYRNFLGIIEHTHYHLGQIAILKKLLQQVDNSTAA